jgi:pseudouridine-5'-phosphate glycosidase
VKVSDEVAAARSGGQPVVALESTIIAHGLPRPDNLRVARGCRARRRARGDRAHRIAREVVVKRGAGGTEWSGGATSLRVAAEPAAVAAPGARLAR